MNTVTMSANTVTMSAAGGIPPSFLEHRSVEPCDHPKHRSEFEARNRRCRIDPIVDVDKQQLDEVLARSLVERSSRPLRQRIAIWANAGVMAMLMVSAWLA